MCSCCSDGPEAVLDGCCKILWCNIGSFIVSFGVGPCYCVEKLTNLNKEGADMELQQVAKIPGTALGSCCGCPFCFICWGIFYCCHGFNVETHSE
mmetsp:Transcript_13697/g.23394  ORF Transcript_13697/g.23394 Transcript_13697/m.23394 type:complete len:95 (+) Transcript_13697:17-301(+)